MIFTKNATFPYPILAENVDDYVKNVFELKVDIYEEDYTYRFDYTIDIHSDFILSLIDQEKAAVWMVFQTKDNYLKKLDTLNGSVVIPKKETSLSERSIIQVSIQSTTDISFENNNDLSEFYDSFKSDLKIQKNMLLGFSNDLRFDGNLRKPLVLFEKRVDETIDSEIQIDLLEDVILITYQSEEYQMKTFREESFLNNMYVYIGLSRALKQFIDKYSSDDGEIDFSDFAKGDLASELDIKLFNLMENKSIQELNVDNIDEVIAKITDRLIHRFVTAIGRLDSE